MISLYTNKKDITLEEEECKTLKLSLEIELNIFGTNLKLGKEKIEFILQYDDVEQKIKSELIWLSSLFLLQEREINQKTIDELNTQISDLKNLIEGYKKIAEKLGIIINHKKTQIVKLEKGFTFLQMKYRITDTGKIIVIPCSKSLHRERTKLKKLYTFYEIGKLRRSAIVEQYRSWRGNILKYNVYRSVRNMDALFNRLYGGF